MLYDFNCNVPGVFNSGVADMAGAKYLYKENKPYTIHASSELRDEKFAIITKEFGPKIRFAMSYDTNGITTYMSGSEMDIWLKFLEYQDGSVSFTYEDLLAVQAIDKCFIAALTNENRKEDMCRTESYLKLMFDTVFE